MAAARVQVAAAFASASRSVARLQRAGLVRPRYRVLLDIAVEFGIDRLRGDWAESQADATSEVARARPSVERILGHIEEGFALAAASH